MKSTISVLIVDDDSAWRRILEFHLSSLGFDCEVASSIAETLKFLESKSFDLVTLDLRLADSDPNDFSGATIAEFLYESGSNSLVVIFSAYLTSDILQKLYEKYRVYDVLNKATFKIDSFVKIKETLLSNTPGESHV